jgi:site-specific DNA-methyltransferase (adenine-specific)
MMNAQIKPLTTDEDIAVFGDRRINYYPIMVTGKERWKGGKNRQPKTTGKIGDKLKYNNQYYPISILKFTNGNRNQGNRHHPTQKPVKLMEYLIKTYTLEGETVLDFTMGSGSTGVACKNTGRHFIGIEQDAGYVEVARKRIDAAVRQLEMF